MPIQFGRTQGYFLRCDNEQEYLFDIFVLPKYRPLTEFHLPANIRRHLTWRMYNGLSELQAIHVDPANKAYESFDGALYNKACRTLLYVPRGKTSLHLPKSVKEIGYQALQSRNLQTVTIDPENPHFRIIDGYLYNTTLETLYFVPPDRTTLTIIDSVKHISSDVFRFARFSEIIIHPSNTKFTLEDGAFYSGNYLAYIHPDRTSVNLSSFVEPHSLRELESLESLRAINVDENHPSLRSIGGVLYSKDCTQLHFVPPCIRELVFPDALVSVAGKPLKKCRNLETISIHQNTNFRISDLPEANADLRVFIRMDDQTAVELPRTSRATMSSVRQFLKSAAPGIKPDTERFYWDYYLSHPDPVLFRALKTSSWQVIKRFISENHIDGIRQLISDGRMITRKNIGKALKLAAELGRTDVYELLNAYLQQLKCGPR